MASNAQLRFAFKQFYSRIVDTINPDNEIDFLYSQEILSDADNTMLLEIPQKKLKVRKLLSILFEGKHPRAFIVLREAIIKDRVYQHLIDEINNCSANAMNLIHSTKEENKPIEGLTTLNNEFFVRYNIGDRDIKVYDTETFSVKRSLEVLRLGAVNDMTSCKRHQCIYIADVVRKVVYRVDNSNTITQWPVDDRPYSLSVNSVCNVLVTCSDEGKVKEFTTDGKLISEISLESSIARPWHTVELTTGQLVVCHGWFNDALHRVCIVDLSGRVLQSYGGSPGSGSGQLNEPIRLAVNGVIFVADRDNHRVLMLSPTLSLIREVVSGLRYPERMWFDDETGRLYVADNKRENDKWVSGQVKVYGL